MLFNSFEFIFLFLPLVLIIYFSLNRFKKYRVTKAWLVLASLYFYGYFNPKYLILILTSIFFNFFIGRMLHSEKANSLERKALLILGIVFNIGILGYFKYFDFFVKNVNSVFSLNFNLLNIALPLGISFFTFQQLSFVMDNYKRKSLKYDFLSYCLFVTFFPQLIAGPIVLPKEMLSQFEDEKNRVINYENMNKGLYLFSIGIAKKVLIADSISVFADTGFDKMQVLTLAEGWLTSISYTLQLYFDFSGYCDMAMGIALMFNIILPLNFNSPYKAKNIQEFWKRWHITLGRFLTNYLYIPLGGNRDGKLKTLRNLLVVFIVSGIWHGAGWLFIIWGLLHGISILIHRIWKEKGYSMPDILGQALTLFFVNMFWIFFRANSLKDVKKVLSSMFSGRSASFQVSQLFIDKSYSVLTVGNNPILVYIILFSGIIIVLFGKLSVKKIEHMRAEEQIIYLGISLLFLERIATFLYFNF
ncbi:MAG: MBOAT family O-acyltransferase [Cetobacterium sp.]